MAFTIGYAKSGGTCTNTVDGVATDTTKRTGLWDSTAANYYDGVKAAMDNAGLVFGDKIYASHLSDKDYGITVMLGLIHGIEVICVDDANQDQENTNAQNARERSTGGVFDVTLSNSANAVILSTGVDYEAQDDLILGSTNTHVNLRKCKLKLSGTGGSDKVIISTANSGRAILEDVEFDFNVSTQLLSCGDNGYLELIRCFSTNANVEIIGAGDVEGEEIVVNDCDFSNITGQFSSIMGESGRHIIRTHRLKLGSGVPVDSVTIANNGSYIKNTSLSIGTDNDSYFDVDEEYYPGIILDDTAIYRTLGAFYARSSDHYSLKISGNANTAKNIPFKYEHKGMSLIPGASTNQLIINGTTYTTTLTIDLHFARDGSATDYQDIEAWAEFKHSDGANNGEGVMVSSHPDDWLASGTDLTNTTSLWTGLGGTNSQMKITKTFTIGTAAGNIGPGILSADIFFSLNDDVWFCPQFDFS